MDEIKDTEKIILEAAKEIFLKKGYDGARMQEIADLAGINKSMLHYYFRSKDKLFESVFHSIVSEFMPKLISSIISNAPIDEKVKSIVSNYIDFLMENTEIPLFILRELNSNPDRIGKIIKDVLNIDIVKSKFMENSKDAINFLSHKQIDIPQALITLVGSCIFPVIAKNLLKLVFDISNEEYTDFMQKRKVQLPLILLNGIKQ